MWFLLDHRKSIGGISMIENSSKIVGKNVWR